MLDKKTMRRIKIGLFVAVIVVGILYLANKWMIYSRFDNSYPEISFDEELLQVSVKVTEEELLQGVTATDKKDGDVSDTLMIESMSKLLEGNQRIITYVAFDKDNHVGKAERKIQYTDYTPIRFSLEEPLMVSDYGTELSEILKPLKVVDCIEGDLSSQIVMVDYQVETSSSDYRAITYGVQVTSSCGEVASLPLPVKMRMDASSQLGKNATIELSEYLIYKKVGEEIDLPSYITSVIVRGMEQEVSGVEISSDLDMTTPGVYTASYSIFQDDSGTITDLIIVVEE